MQQKDVGDVDAITYIIYGKSYHIMSLKDPDYVMLVMTTYGTLENSEGSDTYQRYKRSGGEVVIKWFSYREVFGNHFFYRHQFDNNNKL